MTQRLESQAGMLDNDGCVGLRQDSGRYLWVPNLHSVCKRDRQQPVQACPLLPQEATSAG